MSCKKTMNSWSRNLQKIPPHLVEKLFQERLLEGLPTVAPQLVAARLPGGVQGHLVHSPLRGWSAHEAVKWLPGYSVAKQSAITNKVYWFSLPSPIFKRIIGSVLHL
jgi:hypothetical protein